MFTTSSVSLINVNDGVNGQNGAQGAQGVGITAEKEQWYLSTSSTQLTGGSWSDTEPTTIPSGKYLWGRIAFTMSDGTTQYSTAVYRATLSGVMSDVDSINQSITNKVWQTDITNSINTYDGSTGSAIRDRVTQTETDISGITTRVSDVESDTSSLGTRMTAAESSITQNANNINLKVSKDGVISSINQSSENITISADKVDLVGNVTFSMLDSSTQTKVTNAETNASSALSSVNNSIKTTTMHYLASTAASGVTRSTSGWTTTVQSITSTKRYLWTYQTITKVDNSTSYTDPVISGVWGNAGTSITVSSSATTYQVSDSGTTTPTGTWQNSIPSASAGQYLWTRVITTFSDGSTATSYSVARQGQTGTSVTVSSTSTTYQSGTSGTTAPTGTWSTTIPSVSQGNYLWTKTVVTYSDGNSTTSYAVSYQSEDGDTGVGVVKVEQLYRTSNSTSAPAKPTSVVTSTSTTYNTWTLAMPAYNASYPYYYTCTQTTYTDNSHTWTDVARSMAIEDANTTANTANTNASNAVSTANTANTNASNAVSTANTANTNASNAVATANAANDKASVTLGMKVNYSAFSTADAGECYLHGYTNGVAADVDGYVYWNNAKRTVAKKMLNPNTVLPYWTTIYIVLRLSSSSATSGTLYMVWYNSGWKYATTPTPSAVGGTWTWAEATDIVLGQFVEPSSEGQIVDAYLYDPPRNASHVQTTGSNSYQYAKTSVDWVGSNGSGVLTAKQIVGNWAQDATSTTTKIKGGLIQAHTILTEALATNAIMSSNYSSGVNNSDTPSGHYSTAGSFFDLATGNIWTPNFSIDNTNGMAYLNGTIYANAGQIGDPGNAYWEVGTVYGTNWDDHAGLIAHGDALIQSGKLTLTSDRLNSQNAGSYVFYNNEWYDFGLQVPDFNATGTIDGATHKQNFLYIRKIGTQPTSSTLDTDWTYLYRVDKNGDIYWNGHNISDGTYLPISGGTVTGATTFSSTLTVSGKLTASAGLQTTLQIRTNLGSTSAATFTGNASAIVTPGVNGTLGVGNGGTGKSAWTQWGIVYASATNTLAQLGAGTSGQVLKSNGSAAPSWVNQSSLSVGTATKATQDGSGNVITTTYRQLTNNTFDTIDATDINAGKLIVTGVGRFTNGIYGDLIGNVTGNVTGDVTGNASTATTASKATAANLTTTANAVAYYTNTTGAFGSKASANGALYATSANGALSWGTLPIGQGGTGKTAWTQWGIVYASATNALAQVGAGTSGQVLTSGGSAAPGWTNQSSLSVGSAGKISATRSFTVGGTTKNVDWSGAVSFSKTEISGDASTSAAGWMSADDKSKLDSITISTIDSVITASTIVGANGISVTVANGTATVKHANTAITAGTAQGTANGTTLTNGGTFTIPKVTYDAYGHITSTGTNTLTLPSITSVSGNAGTATKFASAQSITLTGDTTGTASSQAGWSIATTTTTLTPKTLNSTTINNTAGTFAFSGSGEPWAGTDWVGLQVGDALDKFQITVNNGGHIQVRQNDNGSANTSWGDWMTCLDSGNYTSYTVTKTGSGASGTWGISISGNAATASSATKATQDGSGNTITSTYVNLTGTQTISGTKTFSAVTSFTNSTASTSKSTGAVKISGGLGVAGRTASNEVEIGDHVILQYNSSMNSLDFTFV